MKNYIVKSPDGFALTYENTIYKSIKQAEQAIKEWANNYKTQGYYSQTCYNGYVRRISLNELPDYCEIIQI